MRACNLCQCYVSDLKTITYIQVQKLQLVITVFLVIAPSELVLWTTVLICAFMYIYWQVDVKRRFTGPTPADEQALRQIEAEFAEAAGHHHETPAG